MHVPVEILKYSKTLSIVSDNAVRPTFSYTESSQKRKLSSTSLSSDETVPKPPRRRLSPPVMGSMPKLVQRRSGSDQFFSRWDSSPASLSKEKVDIAPLSLKKCAQDARRLRQQQQPVPLCQTGHAGSHSLASPPKKPLRRGSTDQVHTAEILETALRIAIAEDLDDEDSYDDVPSGSTLRSDYLVSALERLHVPF